MRRPGQVLSRFELLEHAWDYDYENRSNVVDSYVRFLRKKIDKPFGVNSLETVRGAGYRLREDGGAHEPDPDPDPGDARVRGRDGGPARGARPVHLDRVDSQLNETINQGLQGRINEAIQVTRQSDPDELREGRLLAESEESFGQILTRSGSVLDTTSQLGPSPALDAADLRRAASGQVYVERDNLPDSDAPARLLAAPVRAEGQNLIVVVGTALDDRNDELSSLAKVLLIGGPVALLLASLAGYLAIGAALRPVERMRRRAAAISGGEPTSGCRSQRPRTSFAGSARR